MTYREQLWDVALDQYGFVTTGNADELGIPKVELPKLRKRGVIEKDGHGLYRFPQLPTSENAPYMRAVLWTGRDRTYLSHETALAVREVCDISPNKVHIAVPSKVRINRAGGEGYVVHRQDFDETDVGWWQNIPAVTLATAIAQCIDFGTPTYLLRQALARAKEANSLTTNEVCRLVEHLELVRA